MTTRCYVVVLLVMMSLSVAFGGAKAHAASLQISPLIADIPPGEQVFTYTLKNSGDTPIGVQIEAFHWTQPDGEDRLIAADDLLVVPKITSIQPHKQQLVRVALKKPRPQQELDYRLHFQELPAKSEAGGFVVATRLNISVPLFFAPTKAEKTYSAKLRKSEKGVIAEIENTGSRYWRFSQLELLNSNGDVIARHNGLMYVLPGVTRRWPLTPVKPGFVPDLEKRYHLRVSTGDRSEQHLLGIE